MARTNKYASINFNHVIEKNHSFSSSSSSPPSSSPVPKSGAGKPNQQPSSTFASYSSISSLNTSPHARTHGRMLVLTRPTPKPIIPVSLPFSPSKPLQSQTPSQHLTDQTPPEADPDQISLRPQGRNGAAPVAQSPEKETASIASSKTDKVLPPHLRPGFVPRGDKPGPDVFRPAQRLNQGYLSSLGRYGDGGRPKSGGYDRIRRTGDLDLSRPRSSDSRPSTS